MIWYEKVLYYYEGIGYEKLMIFNVLLDDILLKKIVQIKRKIVYTLYKSSTETLTES